MNTKTDLLFAMPKTHSRGVRLTFFWVGILATFSYRAIIFFSEANPTLLKLSWYVGTIGFIVYFIHRYQISSRRAKLIEHFRLVEKVPSLQELTGDERNALSYIFTTLRSTREKWNYIFIFSMSAIALIAGVLIDIVHIGE
ncbi:MAG: hypothetical protein WC289_04775 [Patescibacteria group bacterium]|jgi:hypothetical protein